MARDALAVITEGRATLAALADVVKDGKQAIDAKTAAELDDMIEAERPETQAAYDNLKDAIAQSRT
ncbi:MAG: hypothetical protein M3R04_07285 [bacterium]|nr:hypothetical protein [bacterium]